MLVHHGHRSNFLAKLDCLLGIGSHNALQEIIKSWLLSFQKKDDDVSLYLDQKETERKPWTFNDKRLKIKAKMQQIRYNWKIMFSDEEKERVEKEGRQDDEDNENMVSNDEEQNIEEDVDVTEVECRFKVRLELWTCNE